MDYVLSQGVRDKDFAAALQKGGIKVLKANRYIPATLLRYQAYAR